MIQQSQFVLGIYPDKSLMLKDTCTPMLIVALLVSVTTWKQPKWPWTDEWIKKWWNITQPQKRKRQCHLQQHGWT